MVLGHSVAALQDSLDSWKGLGSSLVSLWRGRRLGGRLRLRIFIVTAFFAAASVLPISTPTVITVTTTHTVVPSQLNVSTMPGEILELNLSLRDWSLDTSSRTIIASLPYLWKQAGAGIGAPTGLNGSWVLQSFGVSSVPSILFVTNRLLFSTLNDPTNETTKFTDPYAKQFNVACASIPRSTGDAYNLSWKGPGQLENHLVPWSRMLSYPKDLGFDKT